MCWIKSSVLCVIAAGVASAQPAFGSRELVGAVRDPGGMPIEGAIIQIPGVVARSDSRGAFRLFTSDVDTITIGIRRLGYSPVSALLQARNRQWDTLVVEMDPIPQQLAAVKASAARARLGLRDIDDRKKLGAGQSKVGCRRAGLPARHT